MALIGIDEAGRGPVLGSLFVAGVRIPTQNSLLETVSESKSTTTKKIFNTARTAIEDTNIRCCVIEITATELTESDNITTETANAMVHIANELTDGTDTVYVDSCFSDESEFLEHFDTTLFDEVIAEHKADEQYPVVSVAGCMAKYNRELHMDTVDEQYMLPVGSGYPSDATSREFLKTYYTETGEFPTETRLSWSTCDSIREEISEEDI